MTSHALPLPGLVLPEDPKSLPWRETEVPGVSWFPLHLEGEAAGARRGSATVLIRMEPGAGYGAHRHLGGEDVLVLRGGYRDAGGSYGAGCYVRYGAGSTHAPVALEGDEACILFAVAHGGIELLGRG